MLRAPFKPPLALIPVEADNGVVLAEALNQVSAPGEDEAPPWAMK
jgi:hypothetical protein